MRLTIDAHEFATLSDNTQRELLRRFAGKRWREGAGSSEPSIHDEALMDLTVEQAGHLVETSCEKHRRFLRLFAQRGGRAKLDEILATGDDPNPEVISRFVSRITEKARTMMGEGACGKDLFAKDPQTDGSTPVYRLSESTTQSLRCFFPML